MYIHNTNVAESHDNNANVYSQKTQNINMGMVGKEEGEREKSSMAGAFSLILLRTRESSRLRFKGIFMITLMMERDRVKTAEWERKKIRHK